MLEWLTIKQLHAYQYGQFLWMLDDAPLAIGMAWAVIIYASMSFSSQIQLPQAVRPVLDALLALNIDLALDATAIRLGLWAWTGVGLDQQWFGVPWVNFWAWFIVVWSYSGFLRALRPWRSLRMLRWLYPGLALVLSLLTLGAASELYNVSSGNLGNGGLAALLLLLGSGGIVLGAKPTMRNGQRPELVAILVPLAVHAFAILAGFGSGIFARQPVLGGISMAMLAASLIIHVAPYRFRALQAGTAAETDEPI